MAETRPTVAILGAGTMGAGIAQVAAMSGWTVELMDVGEATVRVAIEGIRTRLDRLVEKGRMTEAERDAAAAGLLVASTPECMAEADLLIEAIVEDLDVKTRVLRGVIPALRSDAVIATNTSSLSVTEIGRAIGEARRTVGMHFFNPAPLMRLVEVIAGAETEEAVATRTTEIARAWGKEVARAADVPGFIVNHVARPYYLEAFRILEDGVAAPREIDQTMKSVGGFRMGPLELTDLIGQDVNTATTRSVWARLDEPPLLHPSALQESLVREGHLGRKTGRGVYDYGGQAPAPAIEIERRDLALGDDLAPLARRFAEAGAASPPPDERAAYVFARIVVALMIQAQHARSRGVASETDIDLALRYGVNYPHGPFEWRDRIGAELCDDLAAAFDATTDDQRFRLA
jgi:3-hydroxybutyryl-CoA dehydrogenase